MKLKRFLGAFTALTLIASSVPAFAADSDLVSVGTPYDITLGEYTTDLVAGHVIAVPVDIQSTTDALTSYNFELNYDNTVLKAASDVNNFSDDMWVYLETLTGAQKYDDTNVDDLKAINSLGQKRGSNFNEYGSILVNPESTRVSVVWNDTASRKVNADTPELYIIFDVVSSTDNLNYDAFNIDPSITSISDTLNGKEDTINISNEITKVNACDGAFKIVVKDSELPYYVQGITLTIDGKYTNSGETENFELDACESAEGEGYTEYSFPVRLISAKDDTEVVASIKAKVSDDLDGNENPDEVNWGSVTVSMTNPKTYATATGEDYTGPVRP